MLGRHASVVLFACVTMLVHGALWPKPAATEPLRETYADINLVAVPAPVRSAYSIGIVDARTGLRNLRAALDELMRRSPTAVAAVATLTGNGTVTIVYDPRFPKKTAGFNGLRLAAFHHDPDADPAAPKRFAVVVGRYGIKWSPEALAVIVAHELVGHGMQYLHGSLRYLRELDSECQAYLYQEIAHQDLGLDKRSREMVAFRNSLEQRWCSDFKEYMAVSAAAEMRLWDALNPDVTALLGVFDRYLAARYPDAITAAAARGPESHGDGTLSSELPE